MRRGLDSFFWKLLNSPGEDLAKVLGWGAALLATLVVLIWAVVRVRARYRDDDDPAAVDRAMLLGLGEMQRRGDLSEEEYRSIKGQLILRMKDTPADVPVTPPDPATDDG